MPWCKMYTQQKHHSKNMAEGSEKADLTPSMLLAPDRITKNEAQVRQAIRRHVGKEVTFCDTDQTGIRAKRLTRAYENDGALGNFATSGIGYGSCFNWINCGADKVEASFF